MMMNPIRRVVTMLQNMAKKVAEEGEAEKALFEKFMCYCKTGTFDLQKSIGENNAQVPALQSQIEEAVALKAQTEEELKSHQDGRAKAKEAVESATAIRKKEAAEFAKESAVVKSYVDALAKAIPAIETGMAGGGFLQTPVAGFLRKVVTASSEINDYDRDMLTSFLSGSPSFLAGGEKYVPKSAEIVGILKTMKEEFDKDLADLIAKEDEAKANYKELVSALQKEIAAHTEAIERKTKLIGELGIKIVTMKDGLSDAEAALIEDTKFLNDLEKTCSTKQEDWDLRVKTRAEELQAIHETIKVLNDDDALDLFKKTLPSAAFLQVQTRASTIRRKALSIIQHARVSLATRGFDLDLLALALAGRKVDFTKVFKMIDDLVALLKEEQRDDDNKKEYCEMQLDQIDDKTKDLKRKIDDTEVSIADKEESLKTLASEMKDLNAAIRALDKAVTEASEIRKSENQEYTELMASDSAAKELLDWAKNRLNKFYNPKIYKAPPKEEPAEAAPEAESFLQLVKGRRLVKDAPPPPPETFGAYAKKGEESMGVIAMINLLIKDLDKEMTEATAEEEEAQKSYEQMMSDSASKRAEDSAALVQKQQTKGDLEMSLEVDKEGKQNLGREFLAADKYKSQLHGECDWLLQNYDLRKEARADEMTALQNAKAVLAGADFSLAQLHMAKHA